MSKPPETTPHSDLDGVHEDRKPVTERRDREGQDGADLDQAGKDSVGRPPASDDQPAREDRSR